VEYAPIRKAGSQIGRTLLKMVLVALSLHLKACS